MDEGSIEIAPAVEQEIPKLRELLYELFTQEAEFAPNRETQEKGLVEIISNPKIGTILVARKNGNIVGMLNILCTISTALGGKVALIEDMIVSQNARGQNIGSTLIDYAIKFAENQGCKRITLLTDDNNKRAHRFYERHGFKKSPMIPFRLNIESDH